MGYQARVEEIAAIVQAVAGSGVVHARNRSTTNWGQYIQLFKSVDRINGWQISRRSPSGTSGPRWSETYQLLKFYGIRDQDASELAFQENLDAVARQFVNGRDLTFGSATDGFRIPIIEERLFGDLLCHVAECEITVLFYTQDL